MKKRFLVLTMIACILGLTACGSEKTVQTSNDLFTKEDVVAYVEQTCNELNAGYVQAAAMGAEGADYIESDPFLASWADGAEELGNFVGVIAGETEVTFSDENVVATEEEMPTEEEWQTVITMSEGGICYKFLLRQSDF